MTISRPNKQSLLLLLLLFFILCGYIITIPTLLPITKVVVQGQYRHLDQRQFTHDMMPVVTGGFFSVDLRTIAAAADRQPWVKQVVVRRIWPSTLTINMTEHQPVARWNQHSLLAKDGTVFDSVDAANLATLPLFIAADPGKAANMWQQYQKMQTLLSTVSLSIAQVSLTDDQSWEIALANGTHIVLGKTQILARLARFIAVYPQIKARQLAHANIDLRYTNGFAVGSVAPTADRFPV